MIDLIIPIYNVELINFKRCLLSVISQTIVDKIKVTIVDDASTIEMSEIESLINKVNIFVNIQYLRYNENHGPGYARQCGINYTDNPYIMFLDADDLLSPVAAETLLKALEDNPEKSVAIGNFYSLNTSTMKTSITGTQLTWVFSKLYRRSTIDEYDFCFNTNSSCSYGNEDVGFNVQYQFLFGDDCLQIVNEPLYYWSNNNKNSLTRKNGSEYGYNQGHKGYVMNFIYTFIRLQDKTDNEHCERYAFKHLFDIYNDAAKRRELIEKNGLTEELFQYAVLYYNEVFKQFDSIYQEDKIKEYWEKYSKPKIGDDYQRFIDYLNELRKNS